jgi:hypothetical protein
MTETSGATLRSWLLEAVADLGGQGPRAAVHDRVRAVFGGKFTPEDLAPRLRRGKPGEPAWQNNLDSLYDKLKKSGTFQMLPRNSPWTLTAAGRAEAGAYAGVGAAPAVEAELLAHFRPKDDSDYIARLEGRELVKQRSHERLIADYGRFVAQHGWRPRTDMHPRDLVLQRARTEILVEAKVIYNGNATDGVRAALAQLLMYRHFLHDRPRLPGLVALFSEPVGPAYVAFLIEHGVSAVWKEAGSWMGDTSTRSQGLA